MTDIFKNTPPRPWEVRRVANIFAEGGEFAAFSANNNPDTARLIVTAVNAYEPMLTALGTIVAIMGNVDHSRGGGHNAAKLYGDMLMDCKAVAQNAIALAKGEQS